MSAQVSTLDELRLVGDIPALDVDARVATRRYACCRGWIVDNVAFGQVSEAQASEAPSRAPRLLSGGGGI